MVHGKKKETEESCVVERRQSEPAPDHEEGSRDKTVQAKRVKKLNTWETLLKFGTDGFWELK